MKNIESPDSLSMVADFHTTFQHPIEPNPVIPSSKRCDLRISLLQEELDELKEAIVANDLVAAADAFADLQYVLSGAILEFGLGDVFKELFEEVQRSNMSKACNTEKEAHETIAYFKEQTGVDCYFEEKEGKFLVYRREDNKTMKSIYYSPANLRQILENRMTKESQ